MGKRRRYSPKLKFQVVLEVLSGDKTYENKIAELEQLLGKKEAEIALLKNFLGRSG